MTKYLLPYLAGYIDGDGCFSIHKTINPVKYRAALIICSTHKSILDVFQSNYGGSVNVQVPSNKRHRPVYRWSLGGPSLFDLTINLLPFLIEKQEDAKRMILFVNSCKKQKDQLIQESKISKKTHHFITKEIHEEISKISPLYTYSFNDFSYLAGFIDSECCFTIGKYRNNRNNGICYKIYLCCNNSSFPVFYYFAEKFGGKFHFVPRNFKNPNHRNQIKWLVYGKPLVPILYGVHPFLHHKKLVCEKLIEFHETTLPNGGDRQSETFKKKYQAIVAIRENIISNVHQLNSKGVI